MSLVSQNMNTSVLRLSENYKNSNPQLSQGIYPNMNFMDDVFGVAEVEHVVWSNPIVKKRIMLEICLCLPLIPMIIFLTYCNNNQIIHIFPYIVLAFVISWIRSVVIDLSRRPELKKLFNFDFSSFKPGGRFTN